MTPCWPQPPGHGCEGGAESICESKDPEELRPKCESRVKPLTPQVLEVMEKNGLLQIGKPAVSKVARVFCFS